MKLKTPVAASLEPIDSLSPAIARLKKYRQTKIMRSSEKTPTASDSISFRVDPIEKEEVTKLATKFNMSVSSFIRYAITQIELSEAANDLKIVQTNQKRPRAANSETLKLLPGSVAPRQIKND